MNQQFKQYNFYILLFLTFFVSLITYGYTLTNFSLSVDNETPIIPDFSLPLGRWGTNIVRYHLFGNLMPYYTLLFSLFFMSISSVIMTKIFKLNFLYALVFSVLFISLPQLSYQMVFLMQSDAIALGFFCSTIGIHIFIIKFLKNTHPTKWLWFSLVSLLIMFVIACYQGLIFVPIIIFLGYLFTKSNKHKYFLKDFFIDNIKFIILLIVSIILYYISIKTIFPMNADGNFGGYTSGDSSNMIGNFTSVLVSNLIGNFYYGDRLFFLAPLAGIFLITYQIVNKKQNLIIKILIILGLLVLPFIISFPITNGYNPPRLYISSGITFALLITSVFNIINKTKYLFWITVIIVFTNIFYITNLYYSNHKIYEQDVRVAERIARKIRTTFPEAPKDQIVYFHGGLPLENTNHIVLPNSEIFGGSMFSWDNGNNYRIISFYSFLNIDQFQLLNDKNLYQKIEPNIANMPIWPKEGSIQKFDNVIIVKLAQEKGSPLPCEY